MPGGSRSAACCAPAAAGRSPSRTAFSCWRSPPACRDGAHPALRLARPAQPQTPLDADPALALPLGVARRSSCATASCGRCRRSPTCSPRCARGTSRCAPASRRRSTPSARWSTRSTRSAETLREQRLGAVEATALLHRVMDEVDVAVFAFDHHGQLRLVNRAGERLLADAGRAPARQAGGGSRARRACSTARSRASCRSPSPAAPGAGRSGAARSASAACPTTCW